MNRPLLLCFALMTTWAAAEDFPSFEMQELDPHVGNVCYAVTVTDVNGDGKPDVCALTEDAIVWFENPTWEKHVILQGQTERDNVCFEAHDINGNGRMDFAIGSGWRPTATTTPAPIQWAKQEADGTWTLFDIDAEPTVHRLRWADVTGDGRSELIVVPLQGRGTKGPNWGEGDGVRILIYSIPDDPETDPWPLEVADDSLHTTHNFWPVDWNGDGKNALIVTGWEGVFLLERSDDGSWSKVQLGTGNQEATPFKGASEIKLGRLRDGQVYIATIEPWHGFQVVVYTPTDSGEGLWTRRVIDEPISWGHAVWCIDLDGDGDEELIIGQRDPNKEPAGNPVGPGVWVYDPKPGTWPVEFDRHDIDDGGVAVEDAMAADLDGDGRPEIIAGGRATHNLRVYWNRPQ